MKELTLEEKFKELCDAAISDIYAFIYEHKFLRSYELTKEEKLIWKDAIAEIENEIAHFFSEELKGQLKERGIDIDR